MIRTFAAVGLGFVVLSSGCTCWMEFHTTGKGGSGGIGGDGGAGGSGGTGGAPFCSPGEKRTCYTGPEGTEGQGICQAGEQTCIADGAAFGPCEGEVKPVPENCATLEDDDCNPQTTCDVLWSRRFGDSSFQIGSSVAIDASGNVLAAGDFTGSMDLGPHVLVSQGSRDVFVVKLDPAGAPLWGKSFGDAGYQSAADLAVDAGGNVIVAGHFSGSIDFGTEVLTSTNGTDAFVAKLDATGTTLWSQNIGGFGDQYASSIAVDSQGNIVVVGHFLGTIAMNAETTASADGTDLFAAKFAPDGSYLWAKTFGGLLDQEGAHVTTDSQDNLIIACAGAGDMDVGNGQKLVSNGNYDIFLVKLGADGSPIWSNRYGDMASQAPTDVAVDQSGSVLLIGWFSGSLSFDDESPLNSLGGSDIFVTKLSADGSPVWSRRYGDYAVGEQVGASIATDGENMFLTGFFGGTLDFGNGESITSAGGPADYDVFVAKLASDGSGLWARAYGNEESQRGLDVAAHKGEGVVAIGFFAGSLSFGNQLLTSAGDADAFVAKLKP